MDVEDFPLLTHEITGVDCCGMIMPGFSGETVEFVCNECSMIIGVLDAAYVRELASLIKAGALKLNCTHCGATNSSPELDSVTRLFALLAANQSRRSNVCHVRAQRRLLVAIFVQGWRVRKS